MGSARTLDVLVIGLGPAGARAAAVAAAGGARVLAVDRRAVPGLPVQCAELVPALLRHELALPPTLLRQPIARMLTQVDDERPDVYAPFPGYLVDRAAFDGWLVERAIAAGADCRLGVAVTGIDADGCAILRGGERLSAPVIVAADGPRSRLARRLGGARGYVATRQVTLPFPAAQDAVEIFLSRAYPGGYAWLFPRGRLAHLGVGVAHARMAALPRLLAQLEARLRRAGRVSGRPVARTGGLIPVSCASQPVGWLGRSLVLLAGDAAGLTNPVSGAGIHAAVQSGALAGDAALSASGAAEQRRLAGARYAEEIAELFEASLAHAGARRARLVAAHERRGTVSAQELRAAWIAYPEYWARPPRGAPMRTAS